MCGLFTLRQLYLREAVFKKNTKNPSCPMGLAN